MKRANANIGSHSRRLLTTVRNNFSGSRGESEGWMRDSAAATSAAYGGSSGAMRGTFGTPAAGDSTFSLSIPSMAGLPILAAAPLHWRSLTPTRNGRPAREVRRAPQEQRYGAAR